MKTHRWLYSIAALGVLLAALAGWAYAQKPESPGDTSIRANLDTESTDQAYLDDPEIPLTSGRAGELRATDALTRPSWIKCIGFKPNSVRISWKNNEDEESGYKVERNVNGEGWKELADLGENENEYIDDEDLGDGVDLPDRRYRVYSYRDSDGSESPKSDVCNGRNTVETDDVRFFYGIEGVDDCPDVGGRDVCLADRPADGGVNFYAERALSAIQDSVDALKRLGFIDPSVNPHSGVDKLPASAVWCDGGGCANGGQRFIGLAPSILEDPDPDTGSGGPDAWVVTLHEVFHLQQYRYWGINDPAVKWVSEGQARSIQDKICLGGDRSSCQHFDDVTTGAADYVGEVNSYLGRTGTSINKASYKAVLFWTYLTEKYGTSDSSDPVEGGMDFIRTFWEESQSDSGRDGIAIINSTLEALGHSTNFREVWKDFAVANYAKDYGGSTAQEEKYHYEDMGQPGGTYDPVGFIVDESLAIGEQVLRTGEHLPPWAANYYRVKPDSDVPTLDIQITQDSGTPVYYAMMAIDGSDIAFEETWDSRHLDHTLINEDYDEVTIIVATLDHLANYRVSINGNQPVLDIVSPTTSAWERAGDPGDPDKIRVMVELIGAAGLPLEGVELDKFSFAVGTESVTEDRLLTRSSILNQQWFVMRPPTQTSDGWYDLTVSYGNALTSTETNAIKYVPRDDSDNIILLDRSGSMATDEKLEAAQSAATLYVDSWRQGDQIGVISFDSIVETELGLTDWGTSPDGGSRRQAIDAINGLVADGGTALGDALQTGWDAFDDDADEDHDWVIVLLSDGIQTAGGSSFQGVVNDMDDALDGGDKVPAVYSVAVGPDADQAGMQRASNKTDGTFRYISVPASTSLGTQSTAQSAHDLYFDLAGAYRMFATEAVGQQQFHTETGPGFSTTQHTAIIPVESGGGELIVSLQWVNDPGLLSSASLYDPDGTAVTDSYQDYTNGVGHYVWRDPTSQGGNYELVLQAVSEFVVPDYFLQASIRSEVTMETFLSVPGGEPTVGLPLTLLVALTGNGPVSGATVAADITPQEGLGSSVTLTLHDDGAHNDGAANDGMYGATLQNVQDSVPHLVELTADGYSPLSGLFHREETFSFLPVDTDSDGDGVPDNWEEQNGTDPQSPDSSEDPDLDGWNTSIEFENGTDPLNPDTDGGGAADSSDFDPLDPSNDDVAPTWLHLRPGNGVVYVNYATPQDYARADVFRSLNPDGPFTHLDGQAGDGVTGTYTDTAVVNGTTYCYFVVARAFNFHESQTSPQCATPLADPIAPHGTVEIEDPDNDGVAGSRIVDLTLWASDEYDPESVGPGEHLLANTVETGVTDMMLSNDAGMEEANWEPFATEKKDWDLGQESGVATVYVRFRDAAGNASEVTHASIVVDTSAKKILWLPLILR